MLKSMLVSAVFAGLIAGVAGGVAQQLYVTPVLFEAELYESGERTHFQGVEDAEGAAAHEHAHDGGEAHDHGRDHAHGAAVGDGGFDLGRLGLSMAANIVAMTGFALLLVAGFAAAERAGLAMVDARSGLIWGVAGFAAFQLLPGAGLAPELPGSAAADLTTRQLWWVAAAAASVAGLALLAWGAPALKLVGLAVIAIPHVVGAPHPHELSGVAPPELAGLFAARSFLVGAIAWALLGWLAGRFWSRDGGAAPA